MFPGFAQVWTAVTLAKNLTRKKPLAVKVAGEAVVLFRNGEGRPVALHDRCPHRGVALSLGTVDDGRLTCPFHGWRFGDNGDNCFVPFNPDARREVLGATSFPVEERGGVLWLFTAPQPVTPPPLVLPAGLEREDLSRSTIEREWDVHWTRAMENMLDFPHLPFVHNTSIGRGMTKRRHDPAARMDLALQETELGYDVTMTIDGQQGGALSFHKPNIMVLHIMEQPLFRMFAIMTPIDEHRTRMINIGVRAFARFRPLTPVFRGFNLKVIGEDKAVVESSFPSEIPAAADEVSVRTDKPTLWFRKYYFATLQPSGREPVGRKRGLAVVD